MSATDTVVHYRMDAGVSRCTVRVFAAGLFSAFGHNPTIAVRGCTGEAFFVPGSLQQASVRMSIQSVTLEVTDDVSQKDRLEIESTMRQEVLETSRYPEIVFESSLISANKLSDYRYAVTVTGNMTLHGVTRSESVNAQLTFSVDTLRAYGEFSLKQTDYGIKLVSVAGGGLKVKDEVKVTFDITARKQEG